MRDNKSSLADTKAKNMSYKVAISEDQRKIIAAALALAAQRAESEDDWEDLVAREETLAMIEMLEELPQIEAQHPGVLHGFAL